MLVELSSKQAILVSKILLLRREELHKLGRLFGDTEPNNLEIWELNYAIKLFQSNSFKGEENVKEIPLNDPSGKTRAWMCSSCDQIHVRRNMEDSHRAAKSCCTCNCGNPVPKGFICEDCRKAEMERFDAEDKRINEWNLAQKNVLEESLKKAADKEAAKELVDEISRISEDNYCAGWLMGIENMLWDVVIDNRSIKSLNISKESVLKLRELHQKSGGWWYWNEFRIFVTTEEWSKILEEHAKKSCSG